MTKRYFKIAALAGLLLPLTTYVMAMKDHMTWLENSAVPLVQELSHPSKTVLTDSNGRKVIFFAGLKNVALSPEMKFSLRTGFDALKWRRCSFRVISDRDTIFGINNDGLVEATKIYEKTVPVMDALSKKFMTCYGSEAGSVLMNLVKFTDIAYKDALAGIKFPKNSIRECLPDDHISLFGTEDIWKWRSKRCFMELLVYPFCLYSLLSKEEGKEYPFFLESVVASLLAPRGKGFFDLINGHIEKCLKDQEGAVYCEYRNRFSKMRKELASTVLEYENTLSIHSVVPFFLAEMYQGMQSWLKTRNGMIIENLFLTPIDQYFRGLLNDKDFQPDKAFDEVFEMRHFDQLASSLFLFDQIVQNKDKDVLVVFVNSLHKKQLLKDLGSIGYKIKTDIDINEENEVNLN